MRKPAFFLCLLTASLITATGCNRSQEQNLWVVVEDQVQVAEIVANNPPLPRYLPEGEKYDLDAVGFEDTDGSLYPVMALANPTPRGASISSIRLEGNTIRVLRGRDPDANAAANELLGVFEADQKLDDVVVKFSITEAGALMMALDDHETRQGIPIRPVSSGS